MSQSFAARLPDTLSWREIEMRPRTRDAVVLSRIGDGIEADLDKLDDNPHLSQQPDHENAVVQSLHQIIRSSESFRQRVRKPPRTIEHAIVANTLASAVYFYRLDRKQQLKSVSFLSPLVRESPRKNRLASFRRRS